MLALAGGTNSPTHQAQKSVVSCHCRKEKPSATLVGQGDHWRISRQASRNLLRLWSIGWLKVIFYFLVYCSPANLLSSTFLSEISTGVSCSKGLDLMLWDRSTIRNPLLILLIYFVLLCTTALWIMLLRGLHPKMGIGRENVWNHHRSLGLYYLRGGFVAKLDTSAWAR